MKTYTARPADIKRKVRVIDAADQTLGRLSIQIARILMGKDKPMYTPTIDTGDFVTVISSATVSIRISSAKSATTEPVMMVVL